MISIAASGISDMAESKVKPCFSAMISSWLNIQFFLYSPIGTIPPLRMLLVVSGMILLKLTSFVVPKPSQRGQAPLGLLKEKVFGSGSWYAMPVDGHMS